MKRICNWCGNVYEARRPHSQYCSKNCAQKARRERERIARLNATGIYHQVPAVEGTLDDVEIASAVVQARGAVLTFDAGEQLAKTLALRPMCGRIARGIDEVLRREGL